MESLSISRELQAIGQSTNRMAVWSVVIHLVAGFIIVNLESTQFQHSETDSMVTEITLLPPVEVAVSLHPAQTEEQPVADSPPVAKVALEEPAQEAPPIPEPRSQSIGQRLALLRKDNVGRRLVTDVAAANTSVKRNSVLASFASGVENKATDLARNHSSVLSPTRPAPKPIQRAAIKVTSIAENRTSSIEEVTHKQEISPGISLAGPVSDRQIISFNPPGYPEWAKQDGVEVSVELLFTVLPSGKVKENVLVEKTSGYRDFDQLAKSSLLSWLFETLGGGSSAEQWGRIEFNYRLKQAG